MKPDKPRRGRGKFHVARQVRREATVAIGRTMILNRQRKVAVSVVALDRFWQRARRSLRLPDDSLTVCLVSEAQMTRWNRAYRGKSSPTDVLSFPASNDGHRAGSNRKRRADAVGRAGASLPLAGEVAAGDYVGDIAIAPAVALRNARRLGRRLDEELRILILHGALHLLGYDHETDNGQMNRIERRLRKQLGLGTS